MKLKRFSARYATGRVYEFRCLDMTSAVAKAEAYAKEMGTTLLTINMRGYS